MADLAPTFAVGTKSDFLLTVFNKILDYFTTEKLLVTFAPEFKIEPP